MFYTYIITNELGKIYIGQTEDVKKRLERHNLENKSKSSSYTHKNKAGEWKIIHAEEFSTRSEAIKREKELKSSRGRNWIRETYFKQETVGRSVS